VPGWDYRQGKLARWNHVYVLHPNLRTRRDRQQDLRPNQLGGLSGSQWLCLLRLGHIGSHLRSLRDLHPAGRLRLLFAHQRKCSTGLRNVGYERRRVRTRVRQTTVHRSRWQDRLRVQSPGQVRVRLLERLSLELVTFRHLSGRQTWRTSDYHGPNMEEICIDGTDECWETPAAREP
jgi:hypothetical protein